MDPQKFPRFRLSRKAGYTYEKLAEGWKDLVSKSSGALVRFDRGRHARSEASDSPRWNLLSAETWETAKAVIIRMEIPGINKRDLHVSITDHRLRIKGKRCKGDDDQERVYSLSERAFGTFERVIDLPPGTGQENMEVSYDDGVVTVILPKRETVAPPRP